jgi:hypothetical protein
MNDHPEQPDLAAPGAQPRADEPRHATGDDAPAHPEPVDASPFPRAETEKVLGGQGSPFERAETEALLEAEHEHGGIVGGDDGG